MHEVRVNGKVIHRMPGYDKAFDAWCVAKATARAVMETIPTARVNVELLGGHEFGESGLIASECFGG